MEFRVRLLCERGIAAVAGAVENKVTELHGEITNDGLNDDDNAWTTGCTLLKGDALDMLMNQESGRGLSCWRELELLHEPRRAGHNAQSLLRSSAGRVSLEPGEPRLHSGNGLSRTLSRRQFQTSTRRSRWRCLRNTSVPTMSATAFA